MNALEGRCDSSSESVLPIKKIPFLLSKRIVFFALLGTLSSCSVFKKINKNDEKQISPIALDMSAIKPLSSQDDTVLDEKNIWLEIEKEHIQEKGEHFLGEEWENMPHIQTWKTIITSPDSIMIVYDKNTSQIYGYVSKEQWDMWKKDGKQDDFVHSIQDRLGVPCDSTFFSEGKESFYDIEHVLPKLPIVKKIFEEEKADFWLGKNIVCIESPSNDTTYSSSGAYGEWQFMTYVAKQYDMIMYRGFDQRRHFQIATRAAARLLNEYTEMLVERLKKYRVDTNEYSKEDIWFRTLVLHMYNAGPYNVFPVLDVVYKKNPQLFQKKGPELIQYIWNMKDVGDFKRSSKVYGQVALAMNQIVEENSSFLNTVSLDTVQVQHEREGDKLFRTYIKVQRSLPENLKCIQECRKCYILDLEKGNIDEKEHKEVDALLSDIELRLNNQMKYPQNKVAESDRLFNSYQSKKLTLQENIDILNKCIATYDKDLESGVNPKVKIEVLKKHLSLYVNKVNSEDK